MQIKKIKIQNYRNYDSFEIEFGNKLNIIIGNNAQGKTNLLESIYVLAVTKSFLTIKEKDLVKFNENFAKISGIVTNNTGIDCKLDLIFSNKGKIVKVNNKEIKKLRDYISIINVVIFTADNVRIFKDSPLSRRRYFNIQISQISNNYLKYLSDYNELLKQRNEFLKVININKQSDNYYLDILNEKYLSMSIEVFKYRKKYVDNINKFLNDMFKYITGEEGLVLIYRTDVVEDENKFLEKIKNNYSKELLYKMTLEGPNRDDFYFTLRGKNLSLFGSQGQMRSAVLALKLSEVNCFKEITGDNPILLLDDIFSELDIDKRNNLLNTLRDNVQTIITTTDIENIAESLRKKANIFMIDNGKLVLQDLQIKDGDLYE